jgi:uncharacterized protein
MKRLFPSTILQSLLLFLFGALVATPFLNPNLTKNYPEDLKLPIVFIVAFSTILLLANYINLKRGNHRDYNLKPNYSGLGLLILLVGSFQIAVVMPANFLASRDTELEASLHQGDSFFKFISIVIIAPICEELVNRGTILRGFLTNYSRQKAIIFSSLLFAVTHGWSVQVIFAFIYGILFGIIYTSQKSLFTVIVLHMSINLTTYVLKGYFFEIPYLPGSLSWPISSVFFLLFCYASVKLTQSKLLKL